MNNHRENVMIEIEKFLEKENVTSYKCLELGAGDSEEFEQKFYQHHVKEWIRTDSTTGTYMQNLSEYEDKSFDIIFSCHAFEHCEDPIKALLELKRVARKFVIITTPYHCDHQVLKADSDHIFVLTEMQMKRLFKYVGIPEYKIYTQTENIEKEQDYNLMSFGDLR